MEDKYESEEERPKTASRLSLHNRKTFRRKFPQANNAYCYLHPPSLPKYIPNLAVNEQQQNREPPQVEQDRALHAKPVQSPKRDWSIIPKKSRKVVSPVKRIVCEGQELFELGDCWDERTKRMKPRKPSDALHACRRSVSGSHIAQDAISTRMIPTSRQHFQIHLQRKTEEKRKRSAQIPSPSSSDDFQ